MAAPRRGKNARGFQVRSSVFASSLSLTYSLRESTTKAIVSKGGIGVCLSRSYNTCSSLISTSFSHFTNQKTTQTKGDKPSKAKDDDGDDEGDQLSDGGKAKDSAKPTPKKVRFFAYDTSSLLTSH
jgi:hypothetical protein